MGIARSSLHTIAGPISTSLVTIFFQIKVDGQLGDPNRRQDRNRYVLHRLLVPQRVKVYVCNAVIFRLLYCYCVAPFILLAEKSLMAGVGSYTLR